MIPPATSFDRIGAKAGVTALADRFYDLIEREPRYVALRAMHDPDLTPMRASLAGFLAGWLGGPRDWFTERPGRCVMSLHGSMPITPATAGQWLHAMGRALEDTGVDPSVAASIRRSFARMAAAMMIAKG